MIPRSDNSSSMMVGHVYVLILHSKCTCSYIKGGLQPLNPLLPHPTLLESGPVATKGVVEATRSSVTDGCGWAKAIQMPISRYGLTLLKLA